MPGREDNGFRRDSSAILAGWLQNDGRERGDDRGETHRAHRAMRAPGGKDAGKPLTSDHDAKRGVSEHGRKARWSAVVGWEYVDGQIAPSRVMRFDQRDFASPEPAFDFFFARDCGADVAEALVVDEAGHTVFLREAGHNFQAVLKDSAVEAIGYTRVKDAGLAGKYVDEATLHTREHFTLMGKSQGAGRARGNSNVF